MKKFCLLCVAFLLLTIIFIVFEKTPKPFAGIKKTAPQNRIETSSSNLEDQPDLLSIPNKEFSQESNDKTQNPTAANSDSPANDPDRIENEFTINFNSPEELASFLERTKTIGVQLLDRLAHGDSARIRVEELDRFREFISQEDLQPNNFSPNYYVRTPDFPPSPDETESAKPVDHLAFEGNTLDWLGLEDRTEFRGEGILVALLDTGVFDHPTFKEGAVEHLSVLDDSESNTGQMNGHGTAIASLIIGNSPDAPGVAPDAKVLSIQVLDDQGEGDTFTLAKGIYEAVDRGADVINMSLGSYGDSFELKRAINYALDHDVALIAAVGNDGSEGIMAPARYEGVVAVTGVDPLEQHAYFGNRSMEVDVAAPATGIHAAGPDGSIIHFSGTSGAAGLATGTLVGIFSEGPEQTAKEAVDTLLEYTNDTGAPGRDPFFGEGILSIAWLQNRDQEGIYDIAVASHHLDQTQDHSENIPVLVTAQNRGTETLANVRMDSTVGGIKKTFEFNNLEVGETVSIRFLIDKDKVLNSEVLRIDSSVSIFGQEDSENKNNNKSSLLMLQEIQ